MPQLFYLVCVLNWVGIRYIWFGRFARVCPSTGLESDKTRKERDSKDARNELRFKEEGLRLRLESLERQAAAAEARARGDQISRQQYPQQQDHELPATASGANAAPVPFLSLRLNAGAHPQTPPVTPGEVGLSLPTAVGAVNDDAARHEQSTAHRTSFDFGGSGGSVGGVAGAGTSGAGTSGADGGGGVGKSVVVGATHQLLWQQHNDHHHQDDSSNAGMSVNDMDVGAATSNNASSIREEQQQQEGSGSERVQGTSAVAFSQQQQQEQQQHNEARRVIALAFVKLFVVSKLMGFHVGAQDEIQAFLQSCAVPRFPRLGLTPGVIQRYIAELYAATKRILTPDLLQVCTFSGQDTMGHENTP